VGNIRLQLQMAKEILHCLEIARDGRELSPGEEWLRKKLKQHSLGLASLERTVARFRSRILYLKEGDANTSFFHKQARYRKKRNFIAQFQVGDQIVTSQDDKQQAALEFYNNLIGTAQQRDYTLDLHNLGVQQHDLSDLESPFSVEGVWSVVKDLPLDKAPGPDGFTGRFYKSCWDIIKEDMMAALLVVQRGHVSKFKLLNMTFITLLMKKVDALLVKNYRPISLVHSFAKLVTKVLVARLATHLPSMVSINQSAFIKGRSIQNNFLLVQQIALHSKKEPHILIKLDISKAFDSVSWSFLLDLMQHLGFGHNWCNLISLLLSTSSTRILVNGEPGDHILHRRGLRHCVREIPYPPCCSSL
jgi:hypothetical protein